MRDHYNATVKREEFDVTEAQRERRTRPGRVTRSRAMPHRAAACRAVSSRFVPCRVMSCIDVSHCAMI